MVTDESKVTTVSKRQQVFLLLDKNPDFSPKMIAKTMGISTAMAKKYRYLHKQKVFNWKRDHIYEAVSKSDHSLSMPLKTKPDSQHHTHAEIHGEIPVWLNRAKFPELTGQALGAGCGWVQSKNPNRALLLSSGLGHVTWHVNGRLIIYVKRVGRVGEKRLMANVKKLVWRSFAESGLVADPKLVDLLLDRVQWHDCHDIYEAGAVLPRLTIKNPYYKLMGVDSMGVDGSHPTSWEVAVSYPPLLLNYERLLEMFGKVVEGEVTDRSQLAEVVKSNTETIRTMHGYLQELGVTKDLKKPEGRLYE